MEPKFSFSKITGWVVLGVVVLIVLWGVSTYNTLIRKRENIKTQASNIDVQYQRRFDLFNNLEGVVKGILTQEQQVFSMIAEARSKYAGTQPGTPERVNATNQLEGAFSRLLVVMENYPQLTHEDILAAIAYGAEAARERIIPVPTDKVS